MECLGERTRAALGALPEAKPLGLPMNDSGEAPESTREASVLPAWPSAYG
ncbi:MAG: hypothetical protein OSB55_07825 [Verrucomicrobiota bacterium]|nr:hypothetical protein [Verrucomicrobiota bacterium]